MLFVKEFELADERGPQSPVESVTESRESWLVLSVRNFKMGWLAKSRPSMLQPFNRGVDHLIERNGGWSEQFIGPSGVPDPSLASFLSH